jgi:hypothetical protein
MDPKQVLGELGEGPKRKTGARRRESWSEVSSAEKDW